MTARRVSVVVATRNEPGPLRRCLEALVRQTVPCEVIVADGGDDAETRGLVRDHGAQWLQNSGRIAATGWNLGIGASTGEVVGIMSAHAVPAADYVQCCLEVLESTGAWAVGGRIARQGYAGPLQEAIARATSSPFGVGNARHNYSDRPGWAETVFPGMWPRWVFDKVGFFDPELVRNQDDELSQRIRDAGGRIWYDPRIVVAYEPRSSLGAVFDQYRQYGFWKVRVYQKHPAAIRLRQLVPSAWIGGLSAGLIGVVTSSALRWLLVPAAGVYALLVIGAGLSLGGRRLALRTAAALAAVHAGYGIGMWHGLVAAAIRSMRRG